jgi:hypothetical protein
MQWGGGPDGLVGKIILHRAMAHLKHMAQDQRDYGAILSVYNSRIKKNIQRQVISLLSSLSVYVRIVSFSMYKRFQ